jgi:hypothetical protein
MKKIFYSHPDTVIATLALIFLGISAAFYLWASNDIFVEVHKALTFSPSQTTNDFNLTAAARLDLRGLLNNSPSDSNSSASTVMPVVPTTTVASTSAVIASTSVLKK